MTLPGWRPEVGRLGHAQSDELHDDWDGGLGRLADVLLGLVPPTRLTRPAPTGGPFDGSPYPGIDRGFGPEHAAWFFGRDAETASTLDALRSHRWVWLVGNSGSGKSSVARAGVMAWWPRADAEPGLATVFEPTARATEDMAGALDRALRAGGLDPVDVHDLSTAPDAWSATLRARFGASQSSRPLLVVIDQAEQMFSPSTGLRGSSTDMLTTLWSLVNDAELPVRLHVLVVLRADWLHRALQEPTLAPMFRASRTQVTLLNMDDADVRDAIVLPARQASGSVDEHTVNVLVDAVRDREHALPLLQLVLQDAWRRSPDRAIRPETIGTRPLEDAIGRLVSESASTANVRLDDAQLDALVTSLVELDDRDAPRRRFMRRADLADRGDRDSILQTLDVLVRARIVVARGDLDGDGGGWQLAHEAVLHSWSALVAAIQRRSHMLTLIAALRRLSRESALLQGATLRRYELLVLEPSLDEPCRELLRRSLAAEMNAAMARRRRARLAGTVLLAIAVVLASMVLYARSRQRAADRERREARRLLAETLLEEGREAIVEDQQPLTAITYLTAAREQGMSGPVIEMLFAQATRNLRIATVPADGARAGSFSPAGFSSVVAGADDRDMGIPGMAAETGNYIVTDARLESIWYSADGSRIATLSAKGSIQVWDADSRVPLGPAITPPYAPVAVALVPDGTGVLTTASNGITQRWDIASGQARSTAVSHGSAVRIATFSAEGRLVATAGRDKGVKVWNVETGLPIAEVATDMKVISMAFSPGSDRLVTGSDDWRARVWDPHNGQPLTAPMLHEAPVSSVQFRSDGMAVLTVSARTARLWDVTNGRALGAPMTHTDDVNAATFSPDGLSVATAGADRMARIWDARSSTPVTARLPHEGSVSSVAFSHDGTWLLTTGGDQVVEWDASRGHATVVPMAPEDGVQFAVFDDRGTRVLMVNGDNVVQVLDLESGRAVSPPLRHGAYVNGAAFSPDGSRILTFSDKRVDLWDFHGDRPVATLEHDDTVRAASFSLDSSTVVTDTRGGTVQLWDARTGALTFDTSSRDGTLRSASLSADGKVAATIGDAGVNVWSARGGTNFDLVLEKNGNLAALSPDGRRLAIVNERSAEVWDLARREVPPVKVDHGAAILTAAFSSDGTRLVTGGDDRMVRVWDASNGRPLARPLEHGGAVRQAKISADGAMIVTVSGSRTVRVWDATTGRSLSPPLEHDAFVVAAVFSPDGEKIVVRTSGTSSRIWSLARDRSSLDAWRRIAETRGWNAAGRPNQPNDISFRNDTLVDYMFERVRHLGLADELARASNLTASAFAALPRYPALARTHATAAVEIYGRRGRGGRDAQICLAVIEVLEHHDLAAARVALGTPASISDAELVDRLAAAAVASAWRVELGRAIRDAVPR